MLKVKIALHLQGPATNEEIAAELRAQADALVGKSAVKTEDPKPAKAKKTKAPEPEAEEEFTEEEETEAADDVETEESQAADEETEEEETEEEAKPAKSAKSATLETVLAGFQKYAKKNGRDAAGKILKKYGVTAVRDLKPKVYGEVLAKLG
jgi:hypothetical protein